MAKNIILLCILNLLIISCDNQLEIIPKGQSTLNKLSDLELLLNGIRIDGLPYHDISIICNEAYSDDLTNLSVIISQNKTLRYAWLTYDESVDRASLTSEDFHYQSAYKYINYMNVILARIDNAEGDISDKQRITAEVHIMRAYLHWLVVNIYAGQYDDLNAADKGGIAYVTSINLNEKQKKTSLKNVYENLLKDCSDEYIKLLPDHNNNVLRGDKAWGNAVKAKILMQMKHYSEALPYAIASLKYNNNIEDRSIIATTNQWNLPRTSPSNLIYIMPPSTSCPNDETISLETVSLFEEGDFTRYYAFNKGDKKIGNEAWNPNYASWNTGVKGALSYYDNDTYVNAWGITSDRMYYTAAECLIRTGKYQEGLDLINNVRKHRIDSKYYHDFKANNEKDAMTLLQNSKKIECIGTYETFFDTKRWNTEKAYKKNITRHIPEFGSFTITPESPLWIFPFPLNATNYNSSLTQNY